MTSDAGSSIDVSSTARAQQERADASPCWNCGNLETELLFDARDFDTGRIDFPVVACRRCGLSYTAQVTDEILVAAYSRSYYGSEKAKFVAVIEALVRAGHRRQAQKIIDTYRSRQSHSGAADDALTVLDIGCGRGLLLQAFAGLGARCLGIERDEFPGAASAQIEMHIGSLDDEELADRRFDIIIIWHVLEHITELGRLLEELPRHLNPGGLLVISVPNFSSWQARLFRQHWFHLDIPRHVTHFEKPWLAKSLTSMGLEIVASNTFTASQNVYGFLQSSLNRLFPASPNRLYQLLTRGRGSFERVALLGWGLLAALIMPFAVIESILAELSGRGATLTIYARNRDSRDSDDAGEDRAGGELN